MRINDNKATVEIKKRDRNFNVRKQHRHFNKITKKFQRKICKTENTNNDLSDKEMAPLNKKEK